MAKRIDPELVERVREHAERASEPDGELLFYVSAVTLGCPETLAEQIDELLTQRVMLARGGI